MDETLFTAARRAIRDFDIDMGKGGGLMTIDTVKSMHILRAQVLLEEKRMKEALEAAANAEEAPQCPP